MNQSCGLMWFREDLRIQDNTALSAACQENTQVLAVYIIDRMMWQAHDTAFCRIEFILRNLALLQKSLLEKNIPLLIVELNNSKQTAFIIESLIQTYAIAALYFNEQYEFNEAKRDREIKAAMAIPVYSFTDQIIFPPETLLTLNKKFYSIFTPYKKKFIEAVLQQSDRLLPATNILVCQPITTSIPLTVLNNWQQQGVTFYSVAPEALPGLSSTIPARYWPAGEQVAHERLKQFVEKKMQDYQMQRDFPAQKGTSKLSAYLASGVLSPRQCFRAAMRANQGRLQGGNAGIDCWISELIWREFYKQIVANFPKISMHYAFKSQTEKWPWRHDQSLLNAWKAGLTGYPLIDAAMRQLQQTGWMHNRLRMVVAMFLTKDCFIDWRLGEQYFMKHLIDGDLAANNGGWQWAASTGCDAVPYFRVFNPVRQSERFDPEGVFIKTYCPELRDVPIKLLHDPFTLPDFLDYPKCIVDHRKTRALLKNLLG